MAYLELDEEGEKNATFYLWRNRDFHKKLLKADTWELKRNMILIAGYSLPVDPTELDVKMFIQNLGRLSFPGRTGGIA